MSIKFTNDHEWVDVDGDTATVGITNYAQEQLGDIVFVELPDVGDTMDQGDETGVIESVKAASEVYAPVSGEITEINGDLTDDPALANSSAEADGWMYKIKLSDTGQLDDLMDKGAYDTYVGELG
ncbi:MAG: glycine cleavage system protein GcvH [Rhodospirillales bacterium]|jgi:glycine cleavage system H protein|nr:glycine cleavage system protein GcvH [Rhodospirillales bacterium]